MKQHIDFRLAQQILRKAGEYNGPISGYNNRDLMDAARRLAPKNIEDAGKLTAACQTVMKSVVPDIVVDGLYGPQTEAASEKFLEIGVWRKRDERIVRKSLLWPTYDQLQRFYGPPGTGHATVKLPYTMRLAWDTDTTLDHFTCHRKIVDPLRSIFERALGHYGMDGIRALGLDLFGGCYSNRPMRGGHRLSVHAFAAAVDIDPARNRLRMDHNSARLAQPDAEEWWKIVESTGATSLGRAKDYDWMHFQFCRVRAT